MNWKLLYNSEIDRNLVEDIYYIYKKVYEPKGINKNCELWKRDFNKLYHDQLKKLTFSIVDDKVNIIGYIILTEPKFVNSEYWSKILEGGVFTGNKVESKKVFTEMFKMLLRQSDEQQINFFSEVSQQHSSLHRLLVDLDFVFMTELYETAQIFNSFFDRNEYNFSLSEEGLLINRSTSLFENYSGRLLKRNTKPPSAYKLNKSEIEKMEYAV